MAIRAALLSSAFDFVAKYTSHCLALAGPVRVAALASRASRGFCNSLTGFVSATPPSPPNPPTTILLVSPAQSGVAVYATGAPLERLGGAAAAAALPRPPAPPILRALASAGYAGSEHKSTSWFGCSAAAAAAAAAAITKAKEEGRCAGPARASPSIPTKPPLASLHLQLRERKKRERMPPGTSRLGGEGHAQLQELREGGGKVGEEAALVLGVQLHVPWGGGGWGEGGVEEGFEEVFG